MRRALDHVEIPDEHEARERSWRIAEAAFAERQPASHSQRQRLVPAIAIVATGTIVAAALSSPGHALLDSIRQTAGVRKAQPALFSIVTPGTVLVHSDSGAWIVQSDGAKRRLGAYTSASWSPHGLYVVATTENELIVLTPTGTARWSLARPHVRSPRWTGTTTDSRIAYTTRNQLRVVGGDGRGDAPLSIAPDMPRAQLAWRPGAGHVLAYALTAQRILRIVDADAHDAEIWSARIPAGVTHLEWSTDGSRLLAFSPRGFRVFGARGKIVLLDDPSNGTRDVAATFVAGTNRVAVIRARGAESGVWLSDSSHLLLNVTGRLDQVASSPDGRWLLVTWPDADQWVFVPVNGGRVRAVANVSAQFRSQTFPRIEGWCCAQP